jgi:hypothetical protein
MLKPSKALQVNVSARNISLLKYIVSRTAFVKGQNERKCHFELGVFFRIILTVLSGPQGEVLEGHALSWQYMIVERTNFMFIESAPLGLTAIALCAAKERSGPALA